MKRLLLILPLLVVISCTTPLTIGANVKTITINQTEEFNCERIIPVSAFDTLGLTIEAEKNNAMADLLNKVAAAGGNAVVISNQQTTLAGSKVDGFAWDCKSLR